MKIDKFPETNYGEKIPVGGKSGRNCSATTDERGHKLLPPRFQLAKPSPHVHCKENPTYIFLFWE
jgi:hypothetical protein